MSIFAMLVLIWVGCNAIYSGARIGWAWDGEKTERITRVGAFSGLCFYLIVIALILWFKP